MRTNYWLFLISLLLLLSGCSNTKYLAKDQLLYTGKQKTEIINSQNIAKTSYVKKYVEWCESPFLYGTVSSKNEKYAFVKFDQDVAKFGLDDAPAIPYNPNDLIAA